MLQVGLLLLLLLRVESAVDYRVRVRRLLLLRLLQSGACGEVGAAAGGDSGGGGGGYCGGCGGSCAAINGGGGIASIGKKFTQSHAKTSSCLRLNWKNSALRVLVVFSLTSFLPSFDCTARNNASTHVMMRGRSHSFFLFLLLF